MFSFSIYYFVQSFHFEKSVKKPKYIIQYIVKLFQMNNNETSRDTTTANDDHTSPTIIAVMNETHLKNGDMTSKYSDSLNHFGSKIRMNNSRSIFVDDKNAITLYFEGELYNVLELYNILNCISYTSRPIHEVIILLYKRFGFHYMMQLLNGLFYMVLLDNNIYEEKYSVYIATDIFSSRSFYLSVEEENLYNVLYIHTQPIQVNNKYESRVVQPERVINKRFPPGTYSMCSLSHKVFSFWEEEIHFRKYHNLPLQWNQLEMNGISVFSNANMTNIIKQIRCLKENIKTKFENTVRRQIYNILYSKHVSSLEVPLQRLPFDFKLETEMETEMEQYFHNFLSDVYKNTNINIKVNTFGIEELFGNNVQFDNFIEYDIFIREQMLNTPIILPNIETEINICPSTTNTIIVSPYLDKEFILYILSIYPKIRDVYRDNLLPFKNINNIVEFYNGEVSFKFGIV